MERTNYGMNDSEQRKEINLINQEVSGKMSDAYGPYVSMYKDYVILDGYFTRADLLIIVEGMEKIQSQLPENKLSTL